MRGALALPAALALALALLLPAPAAAQEEGSPRSGAEEGAPDPWRVLVAEAGDTLSMDARSMPRPVGGVYRVWIRERLGSGTGRTPGGDEYEWSLRLEEFRCPEGRSRVLERFYLRSPGRVVESLSRAAASAPWTEPPAGSREAAVARAVCRDLHRP